MAGILADVDGVERALALAAMAWVRSLSVEMSQPALQVRMRRIDAS